MITKYPEIWYRGERLPGDKIPLGGGKAFLGEGKYFTPDYGVAKYYGTVSKYRLLDDSKIIDHGDQKYYLIAWSYENQKDMPWEDEYENWKTFREIAIRRGVDAIYSGPVIGMVVFNESIMEKIGLVTEEPEGEWIHLVE